MPGASFLRAAGGNGSAGSPYLLTDIYGVQGMGSSATYLNSRYTLASQIDASITSLWNGGAGFLPIGTAASPFTGTLDGKNFALINLLINRPSMTAGVGLFGVLGNSTISNLYLLNAAVAGGAGGAGGNGILAGSASGSTAMSNIVTGGMVTGANAAGVDNVGGIVGAMSGSTTLTASSSAATVSGYGANTGGAVGSAAAGTSLAKVSATGDVTGFNSTGGLVGQLGGTLSNGYATGAVTARSGGSASGGLAGSSLPGSAISTAYATGLVSGSPTQAGGFIGQNGGTIDTSYWNTTTSGQGSAYGSDAGSIFFLGGRDTTAMHTQANFAGWDFSANWAMVGGFNPTLRAGATILGGSGNQTISSAPDSSTNLNTATLQGFLAAGNVLVNAGSGSLTIQNGWTWSGAASLTMLARDALALYANANLGASGAGGLSLLAANDGITINSAALTTGSGLLSLFAPKGSTAGVTLNNAALTSGPGGTAIYGGSTGGTGLVLGGASTLSSTGVQTVKGYSATGNGILMNTGATLASSGATTLTGKSTGVTSTAAGILLAGDNSIGTSAGAFSINGGDLATQGVGIAGTGSLALNNSGTAAMTLTGISRSATGIDVSGAATLSTTTAAGSVNFTGTSTNGSRDIAIATSGNASFGAGSFSGTNGRGISISSSAGSLGFANDSFNTSNGNLTLSAAAAGNNTAVTLNGVNINVGNGTGVITGGTGNAVAVDIYGSNTFKATNYGSISVNGAATAPFSAFARGIVFNSGSGLTTDGTINLTGQSNYFVGVGFCLSACATPVTLTSNSGNLTVIGQTTTATGFGSGLDLYGGTFTNNGAGTLALSGVSTSNTVGVYLNAPLSRFNNTGSGALTLSGTAASGYGLLASGNNALISSGNVAISGKSGTGIGLALLGANTITATAGNLSITGGASTNEGAGIYSTGALALANTGTGVLAFNGISRNANGIDIAGSTLSASSAGGSVNFSGTTTNGALDIKVANTGDISVNNGALNGTSGHGVSLSSAGGKLALSRETVTTNNGSLVLSATASTATLDAVGINVGSGTGTVTASTGTGTAITLSGNNTVVATGAGSVSFNGTGSGNARGILFAAGSALATAGTVNFLGVGAGGVGLSLCTGICATPVTLSVNSGNLSLSGTSASANGTEVTGAQLTNAGAGMLSISGRTSSATGIGLAVRGTNSFASTAGGSLRFVGASSAAAGTALEFGVGQTSINGAASFSDTVDSVAANAIRIAGNVSSAGGGLSLSPASANNLVIASGALLESTGNGNLDLTTHAAGTILNQGTVAQHGAGSGGIVLHSVDGNVNNSGLISGDGNAGAISLRTSGAGSISDGLGQISQAGSGAISLRATGSGTIASDTITYTNASNGSLLIEAVQDVTLGNAVTATAGNLDTTVRSQAGTVQLGAAIDSQNGTVQVSGPVLLTANHRVDAGDGAISFDSTVDGGHDLDLRARQISFASTLGTQQALGTVSVLAQESMTLPSIRSARLSARTVLGSADLVLGADTVLSSSATGDAITLVAGRNFINLSGSKAIATGGPGRWLVYSGNPDTDVFNNLDSGNTAIWNTSYPGTVNAGGNRYVFALQPTVTFSSTDVSKTEGVDNTAALASAYVVSGLQPGTAGAYLADTVSTASSGAPLLSSTGVAAATPAGAPAHAIVLDQGTLVPLNGYRLELLSPGRLTVLPAPPPAAVPPAPAVQPVQPAQPVVPVESISAPGPVAAVPLDPPRIETPVHTAVQALQAVAPVVAATVMANSASNSLAGQPDAPVAAGASKAEHSNRSVLCVSDSGLGRGSNGGAAGDRKCLRSGE